MNIHHHLNDATLMAYAAGGLSENLNMVVATHLSMCSCCREKVAEMEMLGGIELQDLPKTDMAPGSLDKVMALLDDSFIDEKPAPANDAGTSTGLPHPLAQFLPDGLDKVAWKTMAPGIKSYVLPNLKTGAGSVRLLKISPGTTIPEHSHTGSELTLVLKGSFSDEIGRFKAGDIADLDTDNHHQPIADTNEDCICLAATEGPLKFKAMVPRLMQYFVGM